MRPLERIAFSARRTDVPPVALRTARALPRSWRLLGLLALLGAGACSPRTTIESARLAEGSHGPATSVQALLARSDTVALLVYDPANCFQCVGNVASWLSVSRARPDQVVFLLTRRPSDRELESMARLRIPAGTVLADAGEVALPPLPSERLYVHGRLVEADSTASQLASQRILRLLTDHR